jgi:predicted TIM-barrel fold metal-dependent hydrolase
LADAKPKPPATEDARPLSPPIHRTYRAPRLKLPPGACDTHFHFIGPQTLYPLKPGHLFSHLRFEDTTIDDWIALQSALGLSRGLHVQSMMYENIYQLLLHAQCRMPDRIRAVAIPDASITDKELRLLTESGVVGYRLAWRLAKQIDDRLVARVAAHGWQVHWLIHGEHTEHWQPRILASPGSFVIEHMGGVRPEQGLGGPDWTFIRRCIDTGRCWVKLSPRPSRRDTFPFDDMRPFARWLVENAPDRVLWGSDWPHPQYFKPMPSDVDLLDEMLDWVPEEHLRQKILVDNPEQLFRFDPAKRATA